MTAKKKDEKAEALKRSNQIDQEIEKLTKEKRELAKVLTKPEVEIPLHQLNLVATKGHKKAKELLGDKWVEV